MVVPGKASREPVQLLLWSLLSLENGRVGLSRAKGVCSALVVGRHDELRCHWNNSAGSGGVSGWGEALVVAGSLNSRGAESGQSN